MIELLKKYCIENENKTGLMLLDMPTGSGKTYNVLKFIKDYLKQDNSRKIFFVTTLKKNLDDPYKDLINDLTNDYDLKDSIFRVLSNTDYVIDNFNKVKDNIKNYEIRSSEDFKQINALMSTGIRKPELYTTAERNFRHLISRLLSKKFKNKKQKLEAIKHDKEWQWVGDLYPVVFSEEKRVFFLTMKKLINQFDTIVEKSVKLYESNLFRDSLVFIDEFDATKSDIQDAIVQNGLTKGIDYIDLFRNIKICLDNHETIPSNIWNNVDNKPSHKQALEKNIRLFDDIANEYHLMQHHKSIDFEEKKVVLFSDFTHNNYTTGDENVIVDFDPKKNINNLELVSKEKKNRSLYEALDRIKGAISYFARFVTILSISYRKNKLQNKVEGKSYGEFTENHALDTVLDSLHLQGDSYRIIREMAFTFSNHFKTKSKNDEDLKDDLSFYANGFSHYDFKDDYSHDNTTVIRKFVFEDTPESILYTICRMSKVIGISATATYKTVIGNYDIDYLKWKLGECYYEQSDEDRERLRENFRSQTVGYDNVDIVVELTGTSSDEAPNWANIYENEDLIKNANTYITEKYKTTTTTDSYYKPVRYYKAVLAFKQFIDNNLQSYLALFSKALKPNDSEFNQSVLVELFKNYAKERGFEYKDDMIVVLDSENFDDKKKKLVDELSKGEKRFVISTYATIGAGQNLQYRIPDSRRNDVVKINDTRDGTEMDFDGIYLDKPTYIINRCSDDENLAIMRVFQMEYLEEVKAISQSEKMMEIVRSYSNIGKEKDQIQYSTIKLYGKRDVKVCATKIVVQAMGRKCRTNCRGKNVFILADSELGDILDYDTLFSEGRMFNIEMVKLAEQFHIVQDQPDDNRFINNAISTSFISNKRILQFLNRSFDNNWNDEEIRLWSNMREYVLQHPTLTAEEWKDSPFRWHYITLGKPVRRYYYQQTGDFDTITKISETDFDGASCVSKEDVNLEGIFKTWSRIKDMFVENGYATEFKEGDYIMSPPLYHNIYKGALGEKVGHEIFKHLGIPLEELNSEEHELFDYKVSGKPIYVDFKYWKGTTLFDADEYHDKVVEKAKGCDNITTVVIANVRDTGHDEQSEVTKGGIKILELSLICNGVLSHDSGVKIQDLRNEYNTD
ncbi:MAG: DEAD/DEAH box helicase family protein [Paludibacteraceae bacterium]|nr:DEAD/DEAH box helicase family protein [Paludibacteraceae bacterium]